MCQTANYLVIHLTTSVHISVSMWLNSQYSCCHSCFLLLLSFSRMSVKFDYGS